jgi:hypothetical protein
MDAIEHAGRKERLGILPVNRLQCAATEEFVAPPGLRAAHGDRRSVAILKGDGGILIGRPRFHPRRLRRPSGRDRWHWP